MNTNDSVQHYYAYAGSIQIPNWVVVVIVAIVLIGIIFILRRK
jgi:hypothetical protein